MFGALTMLDLMISYVKCSLDETSDIFVNLCRTGSSWEHVTF